MNIHGESLDILLDMRRLMSTGLRNGKPRNTSQARGLRSNQSVLAELSGGVDKMWSAQLDSPRE